MVHVERASSEWFEVAARCYLEHHQGCAWCGGSHRVFKLQNGSRVEYFCNGCDFRVGYDLETQSYFSVPGDGKTGPRPDTMCEV